MSKNALYFNKKDNIHLDLSGYLGYNVKNLFIDSCRGTGKSFQADNLPPSQFKKGYTTIFLKRRPVDITTGYIIGLRDEMNKFRPDNDKVEFYFRDGDRKEGIVDIYTTKEDMKNRDNIFIRIIALNIGGDRIKNSKLKACKYVIFDEYKLDTRKSNQKYLTNEFDIFKEFYFTYERFAPEGLKCIFLGNAYSDYSPYQEGLGIDTNQIKLGCKITGKKGKLDYFYTKYKPTPELMEKLIGDDPEILNDRYERFAILGEAINDENIKKYDHLPRNFALRTVYRVNGRTIGIYSLKGNSDTDKDVDFMYYAKELNWNPEYRRQVYVFELENLENGTIIPTKDVICYMRPIRLAMMFRQIAFEDIGLYYSLEYVYNFLPDRV